MSKRVAPNPTVPPTTGQPAHVTLTLPRGKWDTTGKPAATFPRELAAILLLTNAGSTGDPELTDAELTSAAPEAFRRLEVQRNGAPADTYLQRFPRRKACYERLADLLKVEVPA